MKLDPAAWLDRPGIKRLLDALGSASGTARFVGGVVRDLALGETPGDLDLAVTLAPAEVVTRLDAARIKAVPTGFAHGTVTAVTNGTVVEVTTLRADIATDGRRATVAFTDDWQADAARRDFTINALYADPHSGEVTDYFGGLEDLANRRVRFIGAPLTRIAEDHLRILRFFRFHARFAPTAAPDPAGLAACTLRANDLMALSRERIADELLKLLGVPDPAPTLALMQAKAILLPVLPEIVADAAPRLAALVAAEAAAAIAPDALRRLAAILPRDSALGASVAARLKLSNKARKRLASAVDPDIAAGPRALAYRLGVGGAVDRLLVAGEVEAAATIAAWEPPVMRLRGGDLVARGVPQGPAVANTLRTIEQQWVAAGFPHGDLFDQLVERVLAEKKA